MKDLLSPPLDDGLTIHARITEADLEDLLEVLSPYAVSPRLGAAFVIVCLAIVAGWSVAARQGAVSPIPDELQHLMFVAALVIAGITAFGRVQLHLVASSEPIRALLERSTTYVLDETGVHIRGPAGVARSSWNEFTKWSETERSFVLRVAGGAHLLPKASISASDTERLRSVLAKHVKR